MNFLHVHSGEFVFSVHSILHLFLHTLKDCLQALPFILVAFLILEFIEHHAGSKLQSVLLKSNKTGPFFGSLLGCVPQCGFSVLCSNLYAGGLITTGTLLAVYLSTSDEALILLFAHPEHYKNILWLLLFKVIVAIAAGYFFDFIFRLKSMHNPGKISDLCAQDHCGCEGEEEEDEHEEHAHHDHAHEQNNCCRHHHHGIFVPALIHTVKIWGFLFLFTFLLNLAVELIGSERLSHILLSNSILQPFLTALFGFIPNCAASVLLTDLYLEGALSFGSLFAGLCTSAGAGLLVLFRESRHPKENLQILGMLYVSAIVPGCLMHLFTLL